MRVKLLLDTCVWGGGVKTLRAAGHDVVWAGEWARDPGDEEILRIAHAEKRILVTLDKDFGELVFRCGLPHGAIIRLVGYRAAQQTDVLMEILSRYPQELAGDAVITASVDKVRVRTSG